MIKVYISCISCIFHIFYRYPHYQQFLSFNTFILLLNFIKFCFLLINCYHCTYQSFLFTSSFFPFYHFNSSLLYSTIHYSTLLYSPLFPYPLFFLISSHFISLFSHTSNVTQSTVILAIKGVSVWAGRQSGQIFQKGRNTP